MKRTLKRILIVLAVITAVVLTATFVAIFAITQSDNYVNLDVSKLNTYTHNISVTDCTGNEMDTDEISQVQLVELNKLNPYTYMAFVSVEDKRFFQHDGIDVNRILGAVVHNVQSMSLREGASTITQQLIKNTHLVNDKTFARKINEMLLALQLEQKLNKNEILETYLNTIYFGRNAYGIENASESFFGKSAENLTISESATLAGMIKAPNSYSPDKDNAKCVNRRNLVLKLMKENNAITADEYEQAVNSALTVKENVTKMHGYAYYAVKQACDILQSDYNSMKNSNVVIETYCNEEYQAQLENAVATNCKENNVRAIVTDKFCNVLATCGRGTTLANRQIGSTAKPICVYAPAINEGIINQASPVLDEQTTFDAYTPHNYGNKYYGWTTIKTALNKSLNVPAVKTLNSLGVKTANKYTSKFGISGKDLSMALGNVENGTDAETLTSAYATLCNNGQYNSCSYVKKITVNNKVVYERKQQNVRVFDEDTCYVVTDMLTDTATNGTAKNIAKSNVTTAAKTGTVGNSNGNTDAIVCGYTPTICYTVWVFGKLDNSVTGSNVPCNIAKDILSGNTDIKFDVPNGVEIIKIDKTNLNENQKLLIADEGEEYAFTKKNKPTERLIARTAIELSAKVTGNKVEITVNGSEENATLIRIQKGKEKVIGTGNYYVDCNLTNGEYEYYATANNTKSNVVKVIVNSETEQLGLLDYWYFGK